MHLRYNLWQMINLYSLTGCVRIKGWSKIAVLFSLVTCIFVHLRYNLWQMISLHSLGGCLPINFLLVFCHVRKQSSFRTFPLLPFLCLAFLYSLFLEPHICDDSIFGCLQWCKGLKSRVLLTTPHFLLNTHLTPQPYHPTKNWTTNVAPPYRCTTTIAQQPVVQIFNDLPSKFLVSTQLMTEDLWLRKRLDRWSRRTCHYTSDISRMLFVTFKK